MVALAFSLLATTFLFVAGSRDARAGELDKIRESRQITLAHRNASIPFSYLDGDRKPIGYALDLCLKISEAIRQELHLPALDVRLLEVTPADRVPAIVEGRASLECGSTSNTAARRESVSFTIPHFIAGSRLLVRKDSGITSEKMLPGRKAGSMTGAPALDTLKQLNIRSGNRISIVEFKDHEEAFRAVAEGQIAAYVMDDVLLHGLISRAENPQDFDVIGSRFNVETIAIMLPKNDPEFKAIVDAEMLRLIHSGEFQGIYERWFLKPIPPRGATLGIPMSGLLKEVMRYPTDRVE